MRSDNINISIIMPCFNASNFLLESVQSALNQTYKDFEIIIVDDCSTDFETHEILSALNDSRIHVIYLDKNVGPSAARNIAIAQAKGKYILPLDADDKIAPDYLEKTKEILDTKKEVGIVYCLADLFGTKNRHWKLPEYSKEEFLFGNMIFISAMFRKDSWEEVNGFNENMTYGYEDYDFWMSLIEKGCEVYRIPEVLFFYRQHHISRAKQLNLQEREVQMQIQIFKNHKEFYKDNIDILYYRQQELFLLNEKLKKRLKGVRVDKLIRRFYTFIKDKLIK